VPFGTLSLEPVGDLAMSNADCPECGSPRPTIRRPANLRQALWGGWTCPQCRCEFDTWGRLISPVRRAEATDPGGLAISDEKLRVLRPDLYGLCGLVQRLRERCGLAWEQRKYLDEHLRNGDSRAAVVVSVAPLLVAAYTDELDGVAVLAFPDEFVEDYGLRDGSHLLTVNTYTRLREPDGDVSLGPKSTGRWNGFNPIIADFVSDDSARIEQAKKSIPIEDWRRAYAMGKVYVKQRPGVARDGRPVFSGMAAER
jgi:hypothetical protein